MLAREQRLTKSRDITAVMRRGRYGVSGPVLAKALANGTPTSRLVVVVSKKVSKKATVRNRVRRRVIGVVEASWQTVPAGYDIVVTVRDDLSDAPATEVTKRVTEALKRLRPQ